MSNPPPNQRRLRAHAKLTLSLAITGRRDDGYHLIRSEMVRIDLADELEVVDAPEPAIEVLDRIDWILGGARPEMSIPDGADNLVLRAYRLAGVTAQVRLTKRIPAGAGLGGGSADAAACLAEQGWSDVEAAARLGADVPFCLSSGRALVEGIGERLTPLAHEDRTFLVLTPALFVSTALVYRAYDELEKDAKAGKVGNKAEGGVNDLEPAALAVEPRLARWRDMLAEVNGSIPVLAGSGATWFAEVNKNDGEQASADLVAAVRDSGESALVTLARTVPPQSR